MPSARDDADKCMLCALEAFAGDLQQWLDKGGDKRLLEFTPLNGFAKVVKHLAAMQERGETQHLH